MSAMSTVSLQPPEAIVISSYFIAGGILLLLGIVMAALLAFGKGREHS